MSHENTEATSQHENTVELQLEALRTDNERLKRESLRISRALIEANDAHQKDIDTISDVFIFQANEHDYCEVYDEIVEELNNSLSKPMKTRERHYDVEVTIRSSIAKRVTVKALDLDAAIDKVKNDPHDFIDQDKMLSDAARYGWDDVEIEVDSY